jgi:hypothetical protein
MNSEGSVLTGISEATVFDEFYLPYTVEIIHSGHDAFRE